MEGLTLLDMELIKKLDDRHSDRQIHDEKRAWIKK